jgi:hypothetical protein
MLTGKPTALASQFRLTYTMILNLLKVGRLVGWLVSWLAGWVAGWPAGQGERVLTAQELLMEAVGPV